jgi:hypothetical protein
VKVNPGLDKELERCKKKGKEDATCTLSALVDEEKKVIRVMMT